MKISDNYNNYNSNYQTITPSKASVDDSQKNNTVDSSMTVSKSTDGDYLELSVDTKVTNKMSDSERAALVASLKADLDNQKERFVNMMMQMFQKQGITGLQANNENMWRQIASGNFTVDAQTKAEAQQAISEDGYWGVKQTSQRIFDFAYAIAGDDTDKMKEMQKAIEKGFKQATTTWGKELPSISQETYSAINDMFDNYYKNNGIAK